MGELGEMEREEAARVRERETHWGSATATHWEKPKAPMFPQVVWGSLCWEQARAPSWAPAKAPRWEPAKAPHPVGWGTVEAAAELGWGSVVGEREAAAAAARAAAVMVTAVVVGCKPAPPPAQLPRPRIRRSCSHCTSPCRPQRQRGW
jgi:hypothetical protein